MRNWLKRKLQERRERKEAQRAQRLADALDDFYTGQMLNAVLRSDGPVIGSVDENGVLIIKEVGK